MMELDHVLGLIRDSWPERYQRGRVTHVHRNELELPDGSKVHLRVLIQTVQDAPRPLDVSVELCPLDQLQSGEVDPRD